MFHRTAALRYPAGAPPRTAVLGSWFRASREVRVFPEGWSEQVAAFQPSTLAGSLEQLLQAAPPGSVELSHAVIVLHRPGEPLLTAEDREQLWRAFHVPVFEQLIGGRGQLLAAECEAHDGLHVLPVNGRREGYPVESYHMDSGPCACGLKSPRLSRPEAAERVRTAAVYAR